MAKADGDPRSSALRPADRTFQVTIGPDGSFGARTANSNTSMTGRTWKPVWQVRSTARHASMRSRPGTCKHRIGGPGPWKFQAQVARYRKAPASLLGEAP